ncbi:MAG: chaperone modulator CbpM [Rhizomicrobium sp.]|nr:chaperone modulator CbpM [Rhizomicrobium sp.]
MKIDFVVAQMPGVQRPDLERWILNEWVKPDAGCGDYEFCEIDVARARLIRDLRDDLDVNEEALPVVLLLLDQLYDLRRRLHDISAAIDQTVPMDVLADLVGHLAKRKRDSGDWQPLPTSR